MPEGRGCRQGAPESPSVCNMVLNDAMREVITAWEAKAYGVHVPALVADPRGRAPWSRTGASPCITHMAFADKLLLVAKSDSDAVDIARTMKQAMAGKRVSP